MLSSLFSALEKWLPRPDPSQTIIASVRRQSHSVPPMLEALEDRCLLSAATTIPAPVSALNPVTGPGDVFLASQPKGNPGVVFLGDSIAEGYFFGTGTSIWAAFMAPLGAADYGVAGQTTQTLLYQLSLGQLVGINPSVVVLTIGTNNLLEGDMPEATAAGILADVNTIHAFLPAAQVLVLGAPPGGTRPNDPYRLQTVQTDALASQMLVGDSRATFVNIAPALEQPDGSISNYVLFDAIHPTALGYFDMAIALVAPIEQAALEGNLRLEASLWGGLWGNVSLPFSFGAPATPTATNGLRALIF